MKVGIMQPYLFPYIGYFQLIHAVDAFVIHEDVQYIKGGWTHRNRIQINDKEYLFTFSLKKDSSLKKINTRFFSDQFEKEKNIREKNEEARSMTQKRKTNGFKIFSIWSFLRSVRQRSAVKKINSVVSGKKSSSVIPQLPNKDFVESQIQLIKTWGKMPKKRRHATKTARGKNCRRSTSLKCS